MLDILLHRILEQPSLTTNNLNLFEKILESLGVLYKFHGKWDIVITEQWKYDTEEAIERQSVTISPDDNESLYIPMESFVL